MAELTGYADRRSVRPGESVRFMISTDQSSYRADIVRFCHRRNRLGGPGLDELEVASSISGVHRGRRQIARAGSYVFVSGVPPVPDAAGGFTATAWIAPNVAQHGRTQTVIARSSGAWSVGVEAEGDVALRVGGTIAARTATPLRRGDWCFVAAVVDRNEGRVELIVRTTDRWLGGQHSSGSVPVGADVPDDGSALLVGGGSLVDARNPAGGAIDLFNGKIEAPAVFAGPLTLRQTEEVSAGRDAGATVHSRWRFGPACSEVVPGEGTSPVPGTPVNLPVRGVTSHSWDSSVHVYDQAPDQYAALEFHDNSLEDAGWEVDLELATEADWPSGVYALRTTSAGCTDWIPFVVRPGNGIRAQGAVVLPTLSYLAYANERLRWELLGGQTGDDIGIGRPLHVDPLDELVNTHPEWGPSTYDCHAGGVGCVHGSWLRPIPNMRPYYRMWLTGAGRNLSGDLYLIDWLGHEGFEFDVITDENLHREGVDLLRPYRVVITGAHPEYVTGNVIDAVENYVDSGGRVMYLGANGFYWVTGVDPDRPHVIEVRRGQSGTRTWESRPGELFLATTGELGGIWKHRGRPPHRTVGIGFAAQGFDQQGRGYMRLPDSRRDDAAFIFDGIGDDEVIGDFGRVMGGAVGDEVDRADVDQGTPPHTLVLARSQPMSRFYRAVIEQFGMTGDNTDGESNPDVVRADVTLFDTPSGGAVFSVGSIAYSGALNHNDYNNNVSTMTRNVINRFLDPAPLNLSSRSPHVATEAAEPLAAT